MLGNDFHSGSPVHFAAAGACFVIIAAFFAIASRSDLRDDNQRLRRFIGWGCIAVWVFNTAAWATPERFDWSRSLPLQFCNIANIFGALAVLQRSRLFQAITYFWAFGLCIWAFLTPTLDIGPARSGFWIFWVYHLFIGLAVAFVLAIDRFRPNLRDLRNTLVFTFAYMAVLAVVDLIFDWNYGFVGPSTPSVPTPVDALGAYPLRLLWMVLAGGLVFTLLWLPWRLGDKRA